ncbi:hypothetical protein WDL1P1_00712 (plasmid) [Variovorax sp. WDL1]|nr:hypothetical protein WDL1P1_00712 [Variovorax sp. WDL1]
MERLTANNKQVGGQSINLGSEQYLVRGLGLVSSTSDIEQIVVAERNGLRVCARCRSGQASTALDSAL